MFKKIFGGDAIALGSFVALAVAVLTACAGVPPVVDHSPVSEAMYVPIGGIEQWVTIKGADRSNPVILFLHGGPGDAASPFADSTYPGWDTDFTLVQWDQRGAGRTFAKTGESIAPTMTVERMTDDGIEVAKYLCEHLHQKKIILTGGSWGSILGVRMAHARPDLFFAYVGLAQVTNFREDFAASYMKVRAIAQSKADQKALDTLNTIGPPPWDSWDKWLTYFKLLGPYQGAQTTAPFPPFKIASDYADDFKPDAAAAKAGEFTQSRMFPGELPRVDLTKLTDFRIPIFLIHGEADLIIPIELPRAYFETIKAPKKAFYAVPGTGHNPSALELEKQREVLLTEVRPLAVR